MPGCQEGLYTDTLEMILKILNFQLFTDKGRSILKRFVIRHADVKEVLATTLDISGFKHKSGLLKHSAISLDNFQLPRNSAENTVISGTMGPIHLTQDEESTNDFHKPENEPSGPSNDEIDKMFPKSHVIENPDSTLNVGRLADLKKDSDNWIFQHYQTVLLRQRARNLTLIAFS